MTSVESRQEPSYRPFLILNGRDKLVFVTAQQTRKLLRFIWVCGDWVRFSLVMSGTRTLSKACWTSQRRKKSQAQLSVIQPKTKWKKWPSNAHKWMLGAKKSISETWFECHPSNQIKYCLFLALQTWWGPLHQSRGYRDSRYIFSGFNF